MSERVFVGVGLLAALAAVRSEAIAGWCGNKGCRVTGGDFVADIRLEDGKSFERVGFTALVVLIDGTDLLDVLVGLERLKELGGDRERRSRSLSW